MTKSPPFLVYFITSLRTLLAGQFPFTLHLLLCRFVLVPSFLRSQCHSHVIKLLMNEIYSSPNVINRADKRPNMNNCPSLSDPSGEEVEVLLLEHSHY